MAAAEVRPDDPVGLCQTENSSLQQNPTHPSSPNSDSTPDLEMEFCFVLGTICQESPSADELFLNGMILPTEVQKKEKKDQAVAQITNSYQNVNNDQDSWHNLRSKLIKTIAINGPGVQESSPNDTNFLGQNKKTNKRSSVSTQKKLLVKLQQDSGSRSSSPSSTNYKKRPSVAVTPLKQFARQAIILPPFPPLRAYIDAINRDKDRSKEINIIGNSKKQNLKSFWCFIWRSDRLNGFHFPLFCRGSLDVCGPNGKRASVSVDSNRKRTNRLQKCDSFVNELLKP